MTDSKYIDVLYTAKKKPFTKYPKKTSKRTGEKV
jgi:hypothetical protein|tara:strand:+ start:129 stop:230 length:102 start_codon:yes stop_codon:yes gene_type:complete